MKKILKLFVLAVMLAVPAMASAVDQLPKGFIAVSESRMNWADAKPFASNMAEGCRVLTRVIHGMAIIHLYGVFSSMVLVTRVTLGLKSACPAKSTSGRARSTAPAPAKRGASAASATADRAALSLINGCSKLSVQTAKQANILAHSTICIYCT